MTRPPVDRPRMGFTLVELLVVIGIIALLISILLPALSGARRQANSVKCLAYLREIGNTFNIYASNYKGAYPVVRQDLDDLGDDVTNFSTVSGGKYRANIYWTDQLAPYVTTGKMNFMQTGTTEQKKLQMDAIRKSVLWGCPQFEGVYSSNIYGVNVNNNGYAMNQYLGVRPGSPADPHAAVPVKQLAMRWNGSYPGHYYKQGSIPMPAEKMLVADSTLWLFRLNATTAGGKVTAQKVGLADNYNVGGNNFDRYRHGKYPDRSKSDPSTYNANGGRVSFNILYCDGHAATLNDINAGYKAVRMVDPG